MEFIEDLKVNQPKVYKNISNKSLQSKVAKMRIIQDAWQCDIAQDIDGFLVPAWYIGNDSTADNESDERLVNLRELLSQGTREEVAEFESSQFMELYDFVLDNIEESKAVTPEIMLGIDLAKNYTKNKNVYD